MWCSCGLMIFVWWVMIGWLLCGFICGMFEFCCVVMWWMMYKWCNCGKMLYGYFGGCNVFRVG